MELARTLTSKNRLDLITKFPVTELPGRRSGCVIVAAARKFQGGANPANAVASLLVDGHDHFPDLDWGVVPRISAAFFKMSFSTFRLATSCRSLRSSSASVVVAPASLRKPGPFPTPAVNQIAGNPQILGHFARRLPEFGQLHRLGLELL